MERYKRMYKESSFTFSPLENFPNDTVLHGYFQSMKYFEKHFSLIINFLNINGKISLMKERFRDILHGRVTTCMHFRITGYRHIAHCHPVAPYEYYLWAMGKLGCSGDQVLYFHQPEDAEEVQTMIARLSKACPGITFIQAPQNLADWEQMLLMACCNQHIIPNSSFSWWGAVLSSSERVCYPKNWFGPAMPHDIKDLVMPYWMGWDGTAMETPNEL
jgi:hypothetical protein